jgi:hypothetical protein
LNDQLIHPASCWNSRKVRLVPPGAVAEKLDT